MLGKLLKKVARPRVRLVHPKAIEMCDALGLGQWHLRILKEKFEEIDVDNSGNIDPEEFFESMDEARSMLTDELFRVMDLDGNQRIEFDEFVAVSLVYCMYTKDDILKFCFDLFDQDGKGCAAAPWLESEPPIDTTLARFHELMADKRQIDEALVQGAEKARAVAADVLSRVRQASGF